MSAFAATMLASVMPPLMWCTRAWAIEVTGVTWMPEVDPPTAAEGMAQAITSPGCMVIVVPVASSV